MPHGIDWLEEAVRAGEVHTVRVSFADHLGVWRGKRVPADLFLRAAGRPLGFCDGMLVCDVHADLIQETKFSNYETGYPDFYVHPDLRAVRPVGWVPGEALVFGTLRDEHGRTTEVAPRSALARTAARAATDGVTDVSGVTLTLSGRLMRAPDAACDLEMGLILSEADRVLTAAVDGLERTGIVVDEIQVGSGGAFRLTLARLPAVDAGEAGVIAKGALKELARGAGVEAIFMTRPWGGAEPSTWAVELRVREECPSAPIDEAARILVAFAHDARGLLAPSVTAFRVGPLPATVADIDGRTTLSVSASAEASPETAVACAIALAEACQRGTEHAPGETRPPADLATAADRLEAAAWLSDWLGPDLPANSAPLLRAEFAMFEAVVTDWEVARYWKAS